MTTRLTERFVTNQDVADLIQELLDKHPGQNVYYEMEAAVDARHSQTLAISIEHRETHPITTYGYGRSCSVKDQVVTCQDGRLRSLSYSQTRYDHVYLIPGTDYFPSVAPFHTDRIPALSYLHRRKENFILGGNPFRFFRTENMLKFLTEPTL